MKSSAGLAALLLLTHCTILQAAEATAKTIYHLNGSIVDLMDQPLPGVRVGLRSAGIDTHTDASGRFSLRFSPAHPLTKDNTNTYEWLELDKEDYFGRTIDIRDLGFFDQPLHEKLGPNPVSDEKAEFTQRMSMDHLLPGISPAKDFSLITTKQWQDYFAGIANRRQTGRTEQVVFQAYIPKSAGKVRAVFLLTRHGIGSIDHPRLRDFAARNGAALVSVKGNPVQRGFYPISLIDEPIARLGRMLKHPELATAPVISFGHSNGTGFSGILASQRPEKVIAWISYHSGSAFHLQFPGVEKVPGLIMHGLIDPFLKNGQVPTVRQLRQARNAPVAMMMEANVAHGPVDKGQSATWDFIAAFAESALRIRLNDDGSLKPVRIEEGWLGANYDFARGGQQELTIAPYAQFQGDRTSANWLPDETFANIWQLYGKTDPRPAATPR